MNDIVMDSTSVQESEVTVIRLEQDYRSTQFLKLTRLDAKLHSALEVLPKALLLDLSDTTYIGAGFLSVLIRCRAGATSINCRFALCGLTGFAAEVVAFTRLNSIWLTYDSRQVAVADLMRIKQPHW